MCAVYSSFQGVSRETAQKMRSTIDTFCWWQLPNTEREVWRSMIKHFKHPDWAGAMATSVVCALSLFFYLTWHEREKNFNQKGFVGMPAREKIRACFLWWGKTGIAWILSKDFREHICLSDKPFNFVPAFIETECCRFFSWLCYLYMWHPSLKHSPVNITLIKMREICIPVSCLM